MSQNGNFYSKLLIKIIFGLILISFTLYIGISPIINDDRTLLLYIIGMILIFISSFRILEQWLPALTHILYLFR